MKLTYKQQFKQYGYVHAKGILNQTEVEKLKEIINHESKLNPNPQKPDGTHEILPRYHFKYSDLLLIRALISVSIFSKSTGTKAFQLSTCVACGKKPFNLRNFISVWYIRA